MQHVYVIPSLDAAGKAKRVPDPLTGQALPDEGANKLRSQYWLRRIASGDVTEGEPPVETPPASPAEVEAAPAAE